MEENQLHLSVVQYIIGTEPIPDIGGVINSKQFDQYKAVNPDAKPLKYGLKLKRRWMRLLYLWGMSYIRYDYF